MSNVPSDLKTDSRIPWVDVGKAVGIALVFQGHLLRPFSDLGVPSALEQMRWIYSFHMPFFFVLVGFVYKDRQLSFDRFAKRQILTRLVPAWTFNIVSMLIWVAREYAEGPSGWVARYGWSVLLDHCGRKTLSVFLYGRPAWNVVTWFLICLFTAEMLHFLLHRLLRKNRYLVVSIVFWGAAAVLMDVYSEAIHNVLGERRHWWLITTATMAMVFYQLGILLRRLGWLSANRSFLQRCLLAGGCLLVSLLTFNLNDPVKHHSLPVVLMVDAFYGNMAWFLIASIAGSGFLIYLSQLIPAYRVLGYVGQVTLTLLCLSGIVNDFVNPGLAKLTMWLVPQPGVALFTVMCLAGSIVPLIACIPIHWLLVRYLPFVLGRGRRPRAVSTASRPVRSNGAPSE